MSTRFVFVMGIALGAALALPALTARADDEKQGWSGSAAFGGALRSGDESRVAGSGEAGAERKWDIHSLALRAWGDYGKTAGDTDTENYGALAKGRRDVTERFYLYALTEASRDSVQDLNLRLIAGAGPGYRIWQGSDERFFDAETGISYRHERFLGREPNRDQVDLRAGLHHHNKFGALELDHIAEALMPMNEASQWLGRSELILTAPLSDAWSFRNGVRVEYQNKPADDRRSTNAWWTVGLQYKFGE